MKRLLTLTIATAALVGFGWAEARACTCLPPPANLSLKQQVSGARQESRAVFLGKVVDVVEKPEVYEVSVKFLVERVWKGKLARRVTILTGRGGGDCGYRFEVGGSYLVYAYGSTGRLGTNICQRTTRRAETADMKYLGKGKKPI